MIHPLPPVQHLTLQDYQTKPWKNGKGQTHDILIAPDGADHSDFNLRFALSPILDAAVFSSFPGADRVITVIEGEGLKLTFENSAEHLKRYDSLRFDTGLAPYGEPGNGPVRVVNVMAKRGVWEIKACELDTDLDVACEQGDLVFLFALENNAAVVTSSANVDLKPLDSCFINEKTHIKAKSQDGGKILFAHLTPAD